VIFPRYLIPNIYSRFLLVDPSLSLSLVNSSIVVLRNNMTKRWPLYAFSHNLFHILVHRILTSQGRAGAIRIREGTQGDQWTASTSSNNEGKLNEQEELLLAVMHSNLLARGDEWGLDGELEVWRVFFCFFLWSFFILFSPSLMDLFIYLFIYLCMYVCIAIVIDS
jgi:hypothetical protein